MSDSREQLRTERGYLPGGTVSILMERLVGLKKNNYTKKDELGRWSAFRLQSQNKVLQIMNIYRIPDSISPGILKSRAQYDRRNGEVRTSRQYRDELLEKLLLEVEKARNEGVKDIIIAGDFNQDIDGDQMRKFMRENGLFEVHEMVNETDNYLKDRTQENSTKQIDTVLATEEVLQTIRESILVDFKDIIDMDHRDFIFDLDIKEYFTIEASMYDEIETNTLDPTKRSHRIKFTEKLDEYIEQLNLVELVESKCNRAITNQEIERLDETISFVLDSARRYVEGIRKKYTIFNKEGDAQSYKAIL